MAPRLEDDLGFLLARAYRAMRLWLTRRLEPLGITYQQFQVLNALCEEDDVSQSVIADRVNVDKTSLARMLGRMEEAGLVCRAVDAADSRVHRVSLTAHGRGLVEEVRPLREEGLSKAVQGLTGEEVEEIRRYLNQIYDHMSQ